MPLKPLTSAQHEVEDLDAAIELYFQKGWTDGLPVVPPTEEKVARFIDAAGREPDEVIGLYPSRKRVVKVEKVAINAVMAGCLPEYFPVVLAIMEALTDPDFGLHGANASTGSMALGFIVNGPIRNQIGMNYRGNVMGPGNRANSSIGRAVRLTQINVMGSIAGAGNHVEKERTALDRSTMGQPAKYAGYHIVENEEDFPTMTPLQVELGYQREQSVVTVFPTSGHLQISAHTDNSGEAIVETIAHHLIGAGKVAARFAAVVLPPECMEHFVRDGWSKADIRKGIAESSTRTVAWAKQQGWAPTSGPIDRRGGEVLPGDDEKTINVGGKEHHIYVVSAGGPAGAFIHLLLPYGGGPISKVIRA